MKVHLIKKQTIENYERNNAGCRTFFRLWISVIKNADWNIPKDIQATFGSADLLGAGSNRIVFNIGGNKYRLICSYVFGIKEVHLFICWIGTHAEYTKLCNENNQYSVSEY